MAQKNITLIKYDLTKFEKDEASSGALCAVVNATVFNGDSYPDTPNIDTQNNGTPTNGFFGTGVCIVSNSSQYTIIIGSKQYKFDSQGRGILIEEGAETTTKTQIKIMMATVKNAVNYSGSVVTSSTTVTSKKTRSGYSDGEAEYGDYIKSIDTLNPRDQFAAQALRGLLSHIDNPYALSDSEMNLYCNAAYQWAANMMSAAANARGSLEDQTLTDKTRNVAVGELETNTEKLLNNILAELERNDAPVGEDGTWIKAGEEDVTGKYTNAVAATLPHSVEHPAYANIAAAEADGWVWVADKYAENTAFSEITMKGLEKLARQHRGAHKLSDEDTEDAQDSVIDPDEEDDTIRFYDMSLYEHVVKKWLKAFAKKLAANETRDTLGLHELIDALQRTDYSEVENEETVYSERIINPKLNKLLEDLQETISGSKYERVTVYKLDDILTTLNTLNTTLTTGFANIVTALNTFTSNMNTRFTNVESAISSAKSDVISAMPSTSGLATSSDVSSAESAIISAMPTCKYTPPTT